VATLSPEEAYQMLEAAKEGQRKAAAAELDEHVGYYERAAHDIGQALEYVEDTGTEAAVALRATQRTMSSVATSLRRRAAELRGETPKALAAMANPACEVCGGRGSVNHLLASPPDAPMPCRDCSPEVE
jgi:hypothetical protein